ncbi:hypothetical protein ACFZBU_44950 [Embleya sp. NPDC008237]
MSPAVPGWDADASGPEVAPHYAYADARHPMPATTTHARLADFPYDAA